MKETETKKVLKLKFDSSYDSVREVTFCEHITDNPCPQKPLKRTLFLSHVPPWTNESGLKRIFESNGKVQSVFMSRKASSNYTDEESRDYTGLERYLWPAKDTSGFKFAYIVFEKASGVKKSLNMDLSQAYIISDEDNPVHMGIRKWKRNYNQSIVAESDIEELKKSIEEFVQTTDSKREEAKLKAEEEAEPDDDGWVTVSKKSRKKSTLGAGKSDKVKARLKAREAKKKKNRELRNFYKFQLKETKLKRLQELRDKFEADKEKQKKLISERKFRPS